MKQLSPLHASRSYRPSGLNDPKAAHHSWSFAGIPSDSHRLCFRFHGFIEWSAGLPPHDRLQLSPQTNRPGLPTRSVFEPCPRGLLTRVSLMLYCFRSTDETVSSAFAFRRLAPVDPTADDRLEPLRLAPLSAPAISLPDAHLPFLAGLTLFPVSDRTLLPAPLLACANRGFR